MTEQATAAMDQGSVTQPAGPLPAGKEAPDFALAASTGDKIRLSELRGRPVILAFYPADWSPVCSDQMSFLNEVLLQFAPFDAQLLGISVDSVWSHKAFAEQRNLHFPLLADFEPKGAVTKTYGVYRTDGGGTSERALFVIDGAGIIRWSFVSPRGENPGADGILRALEALPRQAGQ